MGIRISLPTATQIANPPLAHPYPIQVAFQTTEFLNGTMFHLMLLDFAAGDFVRQPEAIEKLEQRARNSGLKDEALKQGWDSLTKYMPIFEKFVFQQALISMNSHWDWLIRNLVEFTLSAMSTTPGPANDEKFIKLFKNLSYKSIPIQIIAFCEFLKNTTEIGKQDFENLKEMSLVRNLGLHNRWEVDQKYLGQSTTKIYSLGEIREIGTMELGEWHKALLTAIHAIAFPLAKRFKAAPPYPV